MGNFSMKMASAVSSVALIATALSASVVSAASEFLPYAELLKDNGVINAQSSEYGYRLSSNITRAEMAKVVANLGGITPTSCAGTMYKDVSSTLGDLCGYIEALSENGVVAKANQFRPMDNVTRGEMVKMILASIGEEQSSASAGYTDVPATLGDLAGYINRANEMGCAAKATYFRVNSPSSRGEAFKIAACAAGLEPNKPTTPPGPVTNTGVTNTGVTNTGVVASGALTVALDGQAVAQYVPWNASSVKVGAVKLTAGATPVDVSSFVLDRTGLGNRDSVSTIAVYVNGVEAKGSMYYNPSTQKATAYFYPALNVPANSSVVAEVRVSLTNQSTNQNSQHQFTLSSVAAKNAVVTGAPVTLGLLNTTSYGVSTTTAKISGTANLNVGKLQEVIGTVEVRADQAGTNLTSFVLTNSGTADLAKVFANVKVLRNGAVVGQGVVTARDKIQVTFSTPLALTTSTTSLEVRADTIGNDGSNSVVLVFDKSTDLSATESTGYGTATSLTGSATVSVSSVKFTFDRTTTKDESYAPGTAGIKLYEAKLASDVGLRIRKLTLALTTGTNFLNYNTGTVVVSVDGSDRGTLKLTDGSVDVTDIIVEAGKPVTIALRGDARSDATVGTTYTVKGTIVQAEYLSNQQSATPSKTEEIGHTVTLSQGKYTVEKSANTPAVTTVAVGTDASMLYLNLRASTEKQILKALTVTTSTGKLSDIASKVALIRTSDNVSIKEITDSNSLTGTVTFDSMNETLDPTKGNQEYQVRLTLKSSDVSTLGNKFTLSVNPANVSVVRADSTSVATSATNTAVVTGNELTLSATPVTLAIPSQTGKYSTVTFANGGSYDVIVKSITVDATRNASSNGAFINWQGSIKMTQGVDGTVLTNTGAAPGVNIKLDFTTPFTLSTSTTDRTLELVDPLNSVNDDQYTINVKSVTVQYVDRNDPTKKSADIEQKITGVSK